MIFYLITKLLELIGVNHCTSCGFTNDEVYPHELYGNDCQMCDNCIRESKK